MMTGFALLMSVLLASTTAEAAEGEIPKAALKMAKKWGGCRGKETVFSLIRNEQDGKAAVTFFSVENCNGKSFMAHYSKMWVGTSLHQSYGDDQDLRKRAPFDLNCPAEQVTYTLISQTMRGVEGCEQRMTYVATDSGWVANVSAEAR
jgi:hypothetical protein